MGCQKPQRHRRKVSSGHPTMDMCLCPFNSAFHCLICLSKGFRSQGWASRASDSQNTRVGFKIPPALFAYLAREGLEKANPQGGLCSVSEFLMCYFTGLIPLLVVFAQAQASLQEVNQTVSLALGAFHILPASCWVPAKAMASESMLTCSELIYVNEKWCPAWTVRAAHLKSRVLSFLLWVGYVETHIRVSRSPTLVCNSDKLGRPFQGGVVSLLFVDLCDRFPTMKYPPQLY